MSASTDRVAVLFVCLGNVCRSPTAEGVFRAQLIEAGLEHRIEVQSAGTGGHFAGRPPDPRAVTAAAARGFELAGVAQRVPRDAFQRFDHVLAMDEENLADLRRWPGARAEEAAELGLLLDELPGAGRPRSVPDPFYGGADGFERMLDLVEAGCAALLERIRRQYDW